MGLNDQSVAAKLARILLADPLAEDASWEQKLETLAADGRAVLLRCVHHLNDCDAILMCFARYGESTEITSQNPLLTTWTIPSALLKANRLEILISRLDTTTTATIQAGPTIDIKDAILVPTLETPASNNGRLSAVTFPVHKAMMVGDGLDGSVAFGRYTAVQKEPLPEEMVKVAMVFPAPAITQAQSKTTTPAAVDMQLAASAIAKFRQSMDNAVVYEQGWFRSGIPVLSAWLAKGTSPGDGAIKSAVRALIDSVLADVATHISADETSALLRANESSIPAFTRESISTALDRWAERAHTELRDQLDVAFSSPRWARLAWWKLVWHVDDVEAAASDTLERHWLGGAEKEIIWLAGRIHEAGFSAVVSPAPPMHHDAGDMPPRALGSPPPAPSMADLVDPVSFSADTVSPPWPPHIQQARRALCTLTVPPLQIMAQTLLLETLSMASLSAATGALVFLSSTLDALSALSTGGAVAALGGVYALRRLQRRWEAARRTWEADVREEGRLALKQTRDGVAQVLARGGRGAAEDAAGSADAAGRRAHARASVDKARAALARIK